MAERWLARNTPGTGTRRVTGYLQHHIDHESIDDQLKEKLVEMLVVALIVSAFKAMLSMPIVDGPSLAFFCLSVLLLAISGVLVTGELGKRKQH